MAVRSRTLKMGEPGADASETIGGVIGAILEPIDEAVDRVERSLESMGIPTLRPIRLRLRDRLRLRVHR